MRLNKKYLGEPKLRVVSYLAPWQLNKERSLNDPEFFIRFFRKRIKVRHYYKPYEWNYYIHFIDEAKGNIASNRIIWYDYNFKKKSKMITPNKATPKKAASKIKWPKHYNEKEILAIYEKKTPEQKVKILEKGLNVSGILVHKLAVGMGYYYTTDHDEPTWVKATR